jgi:hypothetical protein
MIEGALRFGILLPQSVKYPYRPLLLILYGLSGHRLFPPQIRSLSSGTIISNIEQDIHHIVLTLGAFRVYYFKG